MSSTMKMLSDHQANVELTEELRQSTTVDEDSNGVADTKPIVIISSNQSAGCDVKQSFDRSFRSNTPCVICCEPSSSWDITSENKIRYTSALAQLISRSPSNLGESLLNSAYCLTCQDLIISAYDIIANISKLEKKLRPLKLSIIQNIQNKDLRGSPSRSRGAVKCHDVSGSKTADATKSFVKLRRQLKEGIKKSESLDESQPSSHDQMLPVSFPDFTSGMIQTSANIHPQKKELQSSHSRDSSSDASFHLSTKENKVLPTTPPRKRMKATKKCTVKCKDEKCTRKFVNERHMMVHFRKDHEGSDKPYFCDLCEKSFNRRERYSYHMKIHDESNMVPSSCEQCGKVYASKQKLRKHVQQCHIKARTKPKREYQCTKCPNVYCSLSSLNRHNIITHTKEYPFHCEICGQGYATKTDLKYHVGHHYEDDPLKCKECGKTVATPKDLKYHQRSHTGEYPFRCDICNKGLSTQTALKRHVATHSDSRDFQCDICQKSYTSLIRLNAHRKFHTDEKKHLCDVCGKGYHNRWILEAHYRIHTGEHPYECHICHKKFMHNNYIKKHLAYHERAAQEGRELKIKPNFHRKDTIAPGVLNKTSENLVESDSITVDHFFKNVQ